MTRLGMPLSQRIAWKRVQWPLCAHYPNAHQSRGAAAHSAQAWRDIADAIDRLPRKPQSRCPSQRIAQRIRRPSRLHFSRLAVIPRSRVGLYSRPRIGLHSRNSRLSPGICSHTSN